MPLGSLIGSGIIATPSPDLLGHPPLSSILHPLRHQMEFLDKLLYLLVKSCLVMKNRSYSSESFQFPCLALN